MRLELSRFVRVPTTKGQSGTSSILYVSSFTSDFAARHYITRLVGSQSLSSLGPSLSMPGFEPGPQRIPNISRQIHYALSYPGFYLPAYATTIRKYSCGSTRLSKPKTEK